MVKPATEFRVGERMRVMRNRSGFEHFKPGREAVIAGRYVNTNKSSHALLNFVDSSFGAGASCYWDDLELAEGPW